MPGKKQNNNVSTATNDGVLSRHYNLVKLLAVESVCLALITAEMFSNIIILMVQSEKQP